MGRKKLDKKDADTAITEVTLVIITCIQSVQTYQGCVMSTCLAVFRFLQKQSSDIRSFFLEKYVLIKKDSFLVYMVCTRLGWLGLSIDFLNTPNTHHTFYLWYTLLLINVVYHLFNKQSLCLVDTKVHSFNSSLIQPFSRIAWALTVTLQSGFSCYSNLMKHVASILTLAKTATRCFLILTKVIGFKKSLR